jgi:hypothetical protein
MNNKLRTIHKRNYYLRKLHKLTADLKYWEVINLPDDEGYETRVIDSNSDVLYNIDVSNTLNVPKKMGICYGKKRKAL